MDNDVLFEYETNCPVCDHKCRVLRARSSRLMVQRRDPDFCVYYSGLDPYLYNVWICPECGYVGPEGDFLSGLPEKIKNTLKAFLQDKNVKFNFTGERTVAQAIMLHLWAIKLAEVSRQKSSALAALNLKLAWLYRKSDGPVKEKKRLAKALEYYLQAYDHEPLPLGKMTELMLNYLIGELYRVTGKYKESIRWFSRVVSSQQGKYEPGVVRMAREQWLLAREEAKKSVAEPENAAATTVSLKKAEPAEAKTAYKPPAKRRIMVTKKVSLYEDDVYWLQRTLSGISGQKLVLNTDAVLRSVIALVKDIAVDKKISTEEELTAYLLKQILDKKQS